MKELFNIHGRLNRQPYILRTLAVSALMLGLIYIPQQFQARLPVVVGVLTLLVTLVLAAYAIVQNIVRLHDVDRSGWFSLLQLVPLVNIAMGLYLLFAKGTTGPNRFGEDPLLGA